MEMVEDLIVAAHADAKRKIETMAAEEMQKMTGGMELAARDEVAFLVRVTGNAHAIPFIPAKAGSPGLSERRLALLCKTGLPLARERTERSPGRPQPAQNQFRLDRELSLTLCYDRSSPRKAGIQNCLGLMRLPGSRECELVHLDPRLRGDERGERLLGCV